MPALAMDGYAADLAFMEELVEVEVMSRMTPTQSPLLTCTATASRSALCAASPLP